MPAVNPVLFAAAAPVECTAQEENVVAHDPTLSLCGGVPEMYRRTLTAMIDGQKVSPLIPLSFVSCWSKTSKTDEHEDTTKPMKGELMEKAAFEAEKEPEKRNEEEEASPPSPDVSPWVLKPSVGTWLVPLHAKEEAGGETASKAFETSVPADPQPKAVSVATVRSKGLTAKVKSWFCCVQASAAAPKPAKRAPKASKEFKTTQPKTTLAQNKS